MTRDTAERARERSCFYCANTHNFTEEKCECACHKVAPTWDALEAIEKDLGWTIPQLIAIQKLQAEARERLAAWMVERSFATGHGDTFEDLLKELDWQVKELRGARLEEAKWWNSLQEHQRHHSLVSLTCSADNIPTIEACARLGCKMCERIAALAQALQLEEREGT